MNTQQEQSRANGIAWAYLIILALIWGSSFILIKKSLIGYSAADVATIRLLSAAAVMIPAAAFNLRKVERSRLVFILISAFLGMFLPAYCFCIAETELPSAVVGVLNALTPLFTFLLSFLFVRPVFNISRVGGLLLGFGGTCLLSMVTSDGNFTLTSGALLVILATICYGININVVKNKLATVKPEHVSTLAVSAAGVMGLIYVLSADTHFFGRLSPGMPLWAGITLGVVNTAVAQLLLYRLIRMTSAVFASSNTYLIPVVAIGWGIWDGEKLGLVQVGGIALVIAGVWLCNRRVKA